MSTEAKCPFNHAAGGGTTNYDWWPNQLHLDLLSAHSSKSDPLGGKFDYAEAFKKLDYFALKKDLLALMTDSQDWWPADFGHYGPQFVRMTWHAAGTYRTSDGRGGGGRGQQRFAPLNSWPDNVNIDKSRRLLWPIKQKYGQSISWADLLILTGNVALESMGFRTFGFAGGREDVWEPDNDANWGNEAIWLDTGKRFTGNRDLDKPLGATHMGLIYVNPEGPNASGDPVAAAKDIRDHFRPHGDERRRNRRADRRRPYLRQGARRGARVAQGPRARGRAARAARPGLDEQLRHRPRQGQHLQRHRSDLDDHAARWSNDFFEHLFKFEWELTKSPAGAKMWVAKDAPEIIPDAHDPRQEAQADDADHRPDAAPGPRVREDLAPLPRQPAGLCRRLRARLVQADAPRHGPARALPRPRSAEGRADLAGPAARGHAQARRRPTSPTRRRRSRRPA